MCSSGKPIILKGKPAPPCIKTAAHASPSPPKTLCSSTVMTAPVYLGGFAYGFFVQGFDGVHAQHPAGDTPSGK